MNKLKTWQQEVIRLLHLLPWTLRLLWASHRGATIGVSLLTAAQAVVPVLQLWLTKLLVDQIVWVLSLPAGQLKESAVQTALLYLSLEAGSLVLGLLLGILKAHLQNILQEHLVYHVQLLVLNQSARIDLAAYESPEYYDQLHRAQQNAMYTPIQLLESLLEFSLTILTLLSIGMVVLLYQPLLILLLIITTVPSFLVMTYYGQQRFMLFNTRTPDGRRAEYLSSVLTNDTYAKEVRVWGLTDYLLAQIKNLRGRFKQENIALSKRQTSGVAGGELLSTIGYYGAYLSVVLGVIAGRLTLGDLTLYAGVFGRTQSLFEEIMNSLATMYEIQLFAEQLDIFLKLEPTIVAPEKPAPVPSLQKGIEVRNLAFAYPDTDQMVLKNVSFTVNPGECIALVGINGAGKTTLVKCLLRLYDPVDGCILADGRDLRELIPEAWRDQIGVVFQDYARYQLTVQENIGIGNLNLLNDLEQICQVAKAAGIDPVIEALPDGYYSQLGRQFEGGYELSLGQWQRIALARALLRNAPFLILDEPTAAMDAQAEYELYHQFRELAKDRMTLLISHRFSTVRMATRILVLEDGEIIEEGNHEELLAANGRYAQLFKLQAESYQLSLHSPEVGRDSFGFNGAYGVSEPASINE